MSSGAARRRLTRVVVGVLVRSDGSVLLADRPAGKPYPGYWEFPGGKIEEGESASTALWRELHEELGLDIGPSTPWVTFEFDYPHAYVELQFRRVRRWQGEPRACEGQRLQFVHPARPLPQPLLPAAVPVLRWLLLPPTAHVVALRDAAARGKSIGEQAGRGPSPVLRVVEADWHSDRSAAVVETLRGRDADTGDLLFASGPGVHVVEGFDGVVVEAGGAVPPPARQGVWRGAWADSLAEARKAAAEGMDFVLLRKAAVAERPEIEVPPLPVYFASAAFTPPAIDSALPRGHGRWIDLRRPCEAAAEPAGAG